MKARRSAVRANSRFALALALLPVLACWAESEGAPAASVTRISTVGQTADRPNLIVVLVDDMRWDEFGAGGHAYAETPNIDRLAAEGAMFMNAFHAVPLCSPNRASLLTGQYPSRHGIIDNVARNKASHRLQTFPQELQASGYETGFVGKWHMGNDPTPRPGFDYWSAIPGQGKIWNPTLYEDGALHEVEGYITDILTDRAVAFVEQERDQPFLLYLSHKAIHPDAKQLDDGSVDLGYPMVYIPADRHEGRYDDEVFPRRDNVPSSLDNLGSELGSDALRRALEYRDGEENTKVFGEDFLDPLTSDDTIRRRTEMLLSVDDGLGRLMAALEEQGILDETVILFTSDNGYFFGEHGLSIERRLPYEEGIRTPLLVRFPAAVEAGTKIEGLVSSVDIAPTMLDFGAAEIGGHVQGRSLVPLMAGAVGADRPGSWRQSVLVEFYTYENPMPWLMDMDYRAVRTDRYKLIHWVRHGEELYDLEADPFEKTNLIDKPEMADVAADLRVELQRLSIEALGLTEHQK